MHTTRRLLNQFKIVKFDELKKGDIVRQAYLSYINPELYTIKKHIVTDEYPKTYHIASNETSLLPIFKKILINGNNKIPVFNQEIGKYQFQNSDVCSVLDMNIYDLADTRYYYDDKLVKDLNWNDTIKIYDWGHLDYGYVKLEEKITSSTLSYWLGHIYDFTLNPLYLDNVPQQSSVYPNSLLELGYILLEK